MKEGSSNKLFRAQTSNFIFNTGPENFLLQFSEPGFAIFHFHFLKQMLLCCAILIFLCLLLGL